MALPRAPGLRVLAPGCALTVVTLLAGAAVASQDVVVGDCAHGRAAGCDLHPAPFRQTVHDTVSGSTIVLQHGDGGWWLAAAMALGVVTLIVAAADLGRARRRRLRTSGVTPVGALRDATAPRPPGASAAGARPPRRWYGRLEIATMVAVGAAALGSLLFWLR